jgi:hypothetical protein
MTTYKNRYSDIFTFTEDDHQDVLWEGNFEFCRLSYPNDYSKAYNAYVHDGGNLSFNEFKKAVHEWDDETSSHYYPEYVVMVESLKDKIDMIDPSGGPYINIGMSLNSFGFKDYIVKDFQHIETGYKIITEKCAYCHLAGNKHKMGCETRKIQIHLQSEHE